MEDGIFYCLLVHFIAILIPIFSHLGILNQEKSGNPDLPTPPPKTIKLRIKTHELSICM
jgi:hypothetical protein